jgi:hypothetical protein
MKINIFLIILLSPLVSRAYNLVGGKYSNVGDIATARVRGVTAAWLNPAGLANEKSSSISSGASAYTYYFNNQDGKRTFSTSSSTSHVGAVKTTKDYILAFLLYTSFDQSTQSTKSEYKKNSEGFLEGSNSSDRIDINQNIYVFALAPKSSNWGAAINITQTSTDVSISENSQNHSADFNKRFNKTSSITSTNQQFMLNLNFGQQFDLTPNLKLGYMITSPSYLIMGSGNFKYNSIQVEGKGANDSSVLQISYDVDTKDIYSIDGEKFRTGVAYYYKGYTIELDLTHSSGYSKEKTTSDGRVDTSYWLSTIDYYQDTPGSVDNGRGSNEHNSITIGTSIGYDFDENESMGFGIRYSPTNQSGGTGTNDIIMTGGFSSKYKNFIGSYGLSLIKGLDTGKNIRFDNTLNRDVKTKQEFEIISLLVSGAYYF